MLLQFRQARCLARLNAFALRRPEDPVSAASVPSITVSFSNLRYETMLKDGLPTRPTMTLCSAETGSLAGKVSSKASSSIRSSSDRNLCLDSLFMRNASHRQRRLGLNRSRRRSVDYPWRPSATYPDISSLPDRHTRSPQMLHVSCRLTVGDARLALPNFYNIPVRIANVAARLAVLVLWLCDKLGSSTSP